MSDPLALDEELAGADVVTGAVLLPGAAVPKLVRRNHLAKLKQDAVLVDVSIEAPYRERRRAPRRTRPCPMSAGWLARTGIHHPAPGPPSTPPRWKRGLGTACAGYPD